MGAEPRSFAGTDRFSITRRLGEGGMGVVYEVHDRERDAAVALKLLQTTDAAHVSRLKKEFRALADLSHPNLVEYHELEAEADGWFFTMELVDGADFLAWVGGEGRGAGTSGSYFGRSAMTPPTNSVHRSPLVSTSTADAPTLAAPTEQRPATNPPPALPFDPSRVLSWWVFRGQRRPSPRSSQERLRAAIVQLVSGVGALHAAGILHRDLKPSNVLVTERARVVILDFGLASPSLRAPDEPLTLQGTPAYMPPEQFLGETTSASDWYSVGVMIWEALIGTVPFVGAIREVFVAKQSIDPPRPSELCDGVDPALDELCARLLARSPGARPSYDEILAILGVRSRRPTPSPRRERGFVGREEELGRLLAAYSFTRGGEPAVAFVEGLSGLGKSTLVRQFLEHPGLAGALVLRGRCYEKENVPYKALDTIVDSLTRRLSGWAEPEVVPLVPPGVSALTRLFPVLEEVPSIARTAALEPEIVDVIELRRRAFGCLRALLRNLATKTPLVLYIDDLQWGDADSAALLLDIFRIERDEPPPPLLLVASFREEERLASPLLREITPASSAFRSTVSTFDVHVGPLSGDQSERLVRAALPTNVSSDVVLGIVAEAAGSPFFVNELIRWVLGRAEDGAPTLPRLEDVLLARVARLPEASRRFLEIACVSGRPTEQGVLLQAAGLSRADLAAISALRTEHMLRTRGSRERDTAEPYHDRIRETVSRSLEPEQQASHHEALLAALEGTKRAEPDVLFFHASGARDRPKALRYALAAADRAVKALAFDRAQELFTLALGFDPQPEQRFVALRGIAESYASRGEGAEAGRRYLAAAKAATDPDVALQLESLAAQFLLRSGELDEGERVLSSAAEKANLWLPSSQPQALASLLARRFAVRVRGLGYREVTLASVPPAKLARLDVCTAAATGFAMVDPILGADFQARSLQLALDLGEPSRIARALALEACFVASDGPAQKARVDALLDLGGRLARESCDPYAQAACLVARSFEHVFMGRWREGVATGDDAEIILRAHCPTAWADLATAQVFQLWGLTHLGEVREVGRRYEDTIRFASERGDRFSLATIRSLVGHLHELAADAPTRALGYAEAALEGWPEGRGFLLQHWYAFVAESNTRGYLGDSKAAWEFVERKWASADTSLLMRAVTIRADSYLQRGRAALARGRDTRGAERARLLATAWRCAGKLSAAPVPSPHPEGHLLRGGVLAALGRKGPALRALEEAIRLFDALESWPESMAARYRRGRLRGGVDGLREADAALEALSERGYANPERMARMFAPEVD